MREEYHFSKARQLIGKVGNKLIDISVKISALICVLGMIIYWIWDFPWLIAIPFGFPVMTFIFLKTGVLIYENIKIQKYCKRTNLTVEEFNQIYANRKPTTQ